MPTKPPTMHFSAASRILADLTGPETPGPEGAPSGGLSSGHEPSSITIPGYRILSRLGSGGGGEVFKAVRDGSEQPVAIKLLRTPIGDKSAADRAWRELDLLQSLRLPSLPRVLDYGLTAGRLYFATEFIDGLTIDEHCERGIGVLADAEVREDPGSPGQPQTPSAGTPMPLPARVSLLAALAHAVAALHEHGVIHRDLKPSNILIDRAGKPVIIDLGIAALLESASGGPMATLTEGGAPIGTPAFMSPEQARGDRPRISTRSDVYSLGAVATLLLTGRTPHDIPGDRSEQRSEPPGALPIQNPRVSLYEAIRRAAEDEPRDPRTLDPTLPKPLAAVLAKACARDPAARYPSARDLAADLERWLRGEPVTAVPVGRWRKITRWAGKHPILTAAAVSGLLLLGSVAGSALSVWVILLRPYRMKIDQTGASRWAELVTMTGMVLRRWDADNNADSTMKFAALETAPGGRRLAITLQLTTGDSEQSGRLSVWDANAPYKLIWRTPVTPEEGGLELPLIPPGQTETWDTLGRTIRANGALLTDVFTDEAHPGKELIVSSIHFDSDPANISVYDLAGNLLFRVWHWGSIGHLVWLSEDGLIVAKGCDNTARSTDFGLAPSDAPNAWPNAVMAIKPILGVGVNEPAAWLNTPYASGGLGLQWYKYISPPAVFERFDEKIEAAPGPPDRARLRLDLRLREWSDPLKFPAITLYIDSAGRRVRTTPNDFYNIAAANGRPTEAPLPKDPNGLVWLSEEPNGSRAAGWEGQSDGRRPVGGDR